MCTLMVAVLVLTVSGALAQAVPDGSAAASGASPNPNVVVLNGDARFWKDPALDRPVSVSLKNADLSTAVAALAKSSKLSILAHGGAKTNGKLTLSLKGVPLRDAMRTIEQSFGLRWHKVGTVYSLENDPKRRPRFLPMSSFKRPKLVPMQSGVKLTRARNVRRHRSRARVRVIQQVVP